MRARLAVALRRVAGLLRVAADHLDRSDPSSRPHRGGYPSPDRPVGELPRVRPGPGPGGVHPRIAERLRAEHAEAIARATHPTSWHPRRPTP